MDKAIAHTKASLYDIFYASKTKKTYTNLGISLLLIIFFLVFALKPTITTIGTVMQKIETYKNLNASLKTKINSAKNLDEQLNTSSYESQNGLKDEIDFMNKVYMKDYDLETVYINLYRRAKSSNVKILSIKPKYSQKDLDAATVDDSDLAPTSQGYELTLSLIARDIASAINFVKSLEGYQEMPIPSRVKSFAVNDMDSALKLSSDEVPTGNDTSSGNENNGRGVDFVVSLVVYIDQTRLES